ncbi:MAG: nicotinate (nicotinamide) nucleotide adenylyltransferase [Ruminococcaceae bacterium]|nr:nicotinate (nicotinamide) nucleotide adenylyltransferase [Oscillospiraceae bacterium]
MGTIAVFGGTFNPIHKGHFEIISALCGKDFIDKVIIIPTKIPPHKQSSFLADEHHRVKMCEIVSNLFSKAEVSKIELDREGKSYTIDTLCEIKKLFPNEKIAITVGADMLISFDQWKSYKEILDISDIITFFRKNKDINQYNDSIDKLKNLGGKIIALDEDITDISSSQIREMIKEGLSVDRYLLPEIANYIFSNNVYGEI